MTDIASDRTAPDETGPRSPAVADAPIFVVGNPRSGTHLLRYCLNQHSRLHIAFETAFFRKVYGNRRLLPEHAIARHADKIMARLFRTGDPSGAEFLPLRAALTDRIAREAKTYRDVAAIVYGEFARSRNKVRWGEKTPFHVLYIDQIVALFPEARIICMDRDVRAVAASYLRSRHVPNDMLRALAHHRMCARAAGRHEARLLRIRYEDFIDDSETVLRRICRYIGEDFEPAMLRPGMRDSSYGRAVMEFDPAIGIERTSRDRWRDILDPGQVRFIEWMSAPSWRGSTAPFVRDAVRVRLLESRFRLSVLKSVLGYENLRRMAKGQWD